MRKELEKARKLGRFGDSLLAHISPEEAALLMRLGGSGTLNPQTGLPEFFGFGSFFKAIAKPFTAIGGALSDVVSTVIGKPIEAITSPIFGSSVGSALGKVASIAAPAVGGYFAAPYISSMFSSALPAGADVGMDLGAKLAGAGEAAAGGATIPLSAGGIAPLSAAEMGAIGLPQAGVELGAGALPAGGLGGAITGGLTPAEAAALTAPVGAGAGAGAEATRSFITPSEELAALSGAPMSTTASTMSELMSAPLNLSEALSPGPMWESALTAGASPYTYSPMYSMANLGGGGGWWGDLTDWYRRLPGMAKVALPVGALGVGSNLLGGFMRYNQQQAQSEAINRMLGQYLAESQWTPEKRAGMMQGIGGQTAEAIQAGQKRAASSAAAAGRGGGYYGRESERLRRSGLETAAQALAGTWGPSNVSPEAYRLMGQAQAGPISPWYETTQGLGGLAGQALPLMALFKMFGG